MFSLIPKKVKEYDITPLLDHKGEYLISGDGSKLCAVVEYEFVLFLWFKFNRKIM